MAKYDVCPLRDGSGLILDVQAELLDHLNTRVVVPLIAKGLAPTPAQRLNPVFTIDDQLYVMVTQYLSAVSSGEIGKPIANLNSDFSVITIALDMVFQGY